MVQHDDKIYIDIHERFICYRLKIRNFLNVTLLQNDICLQYKQIKYMKIRSH